MQSFYRRRRGSQSCKASRLVRGRDARPSVSSPYCQAQKGARPQHEGSTVQTIRKALR